MPIIKSANKRVRVARRASARNLRTKRNLKSALKSFQSSITSGKKVSEAHAAAQSALAKAGKKGVMHKNKLARKQRQLAAAAKASGAKPAAKKTVKTVKKAPVKKTAPKKTVAKTTAKKAVSKKK